MIQFRDICLDDKIGVLIKTYEQKREFKKWLEKKISWSIDYFAKPPFIVYPYTEKITYLRSEKYDRKDIIEPTEAIFLYDNVIIKEKSMTNKSIGVFMEEKEKQVKDELIINGVKYKRIEEEKPRGLYLEVDADHDMSIWYDDSRIGFIDTVGRCNILDSEDFIKTYKQWREDGMPVDITPVEWREGIYQITPIMRDLKRMDINCGVIYNFDECEACSGCEDENIIRFKHNNRPVLF